MNEPVNLVVHLGDGLSKGPVHVWKSSLTGDIWMEGINKMLVPQEDLPVEEGILVLNLEADSLYSITTTTGQVKGELPHPMPKAASFPHSYSKNFEIYQIGDLPKWFMDQKGKFEVVDVGHGGKCMQQIIPTQRTIWAFPRLRPHSLFGDYRWERYELSADVKFIGGDAEIGGHHDVDQKNLGYRLTLYKVGKWTLSLHTDGLKSGILSGFDTSAWHNLRLRFYRNQLTSSIDGVEVAKLADTSKSPRGLCYLGSNYDFNLFDNVRLECLGSPIGQSGMKARAFRDRVRGRQGPGWGYLNTMLHSNNPGANPLTQFITVDLGKSYEINRIAHVPRKSGGNGNINFYNFYTSSDGKEFKLLSSGKWEANGTIKYIDFPATKAASIKLEATDGVIRFASAAEINIYEALVK